MRTSDVKVTLSQHNSQSGGRVDGVGCVPAQSPLSEGSGRALAEHPRQRRPRGLEGPPLPCRACTV